MTAKCDTCGGADTRGFCPACGNPVELHRPGKDEPPAPFNRAQWDYIVDLHPDQHMAAFGTFQNGTMVTVGYAVFDWPTAPTDIAAYRHPILVLATGLHASAVITTFNPLIDQLIFDGTGITAVAT